MQTLLASPRSVRSTTAAFSDGDPPAIASTEPPLDPIPRRIDRPFRHAAVADFHDLGGTERRYLIHAGAMHDEDVNLSELVEGSRDQALAPGI